MDAAIKQTGKFFEKNGGIILMTILAIVIVYAVYKIISGAYEAAKTAAVGGSLAARAVITDPLGLLGASSGGPATMSQYTADWLTNFFVNNPEYGN